MPVQRFMVIETFRGDAAAVYHRFRERGRLAPEGLTYVGSWVDASLARVWQVMETERRELLDDWMDNWRDLVDFEVVPVVDSAAAMARALGPEAATGES